MASRFPSQRRKFVPIMGIIIPNKGIKQGCYLPLTSPEKRLTRSQIEARPLLPEARDPIRFEGWVPSDANQALDLALGQKHPIERVFVMSG